MIVRTPERRFAVLRVLHSGESEETCVCQDLGDGSSGLYTLARFKDPAQSRYLLPMLARQQSNPSFGDYLGLFTQDGDLYARFRYTEAPLLAERLMRGDFGFRERLEIGGNLFERMALLDMPAPLQFEALRDENLTVDDALRVRFNYILHSMAACFNVDIGYICIRSAELLRLLFAAELDARSLPELDDLLRKLDGGTLQTYLEIYSAYDQTRKRILERTLSGPAEPRTFLFRLWERVKGLSRFVRPVLGGLVLVASLCYLVYTLLLPAAPKGTPVFFDNIGTVEIQQSVP